MANAYSILHNYDRPLYAPNYQLIASAMQYKQGKLDANRARLQTVADQIGFADVAKGEDKEYVENRLQSAVDIANKYAALDLSSSSLTNQLIGKVAEVVDDNVKNAVLSTKVYRSEQAEWAKMQEEKPELYSEDNYQFAMRGANAWLNDGKYGTKYNGGGGFIAYDNYGKRVQDNIIEIAKQLEATFVYQENGAGMFVDNVTGKEVDRGRLEAAIDGVIGDTGREQMKREAWNRSRFVDDEALKNQYDATYLPKMEEAERYVVNLKAMISRETDPNKKKQLQTSLDNWSNMKNMMVSQTYEGIGKEEAFYRLHSNNFKDSYLDAYSYDPIVIKREVDQNHVKTVEFQEKVREFELEFDLKERKFTLEQEKFDLEKQKTMFDMGIDPVTGEPIQSAIPTETPQEFGAFMSGEGFYTDMNVTGKIFDNMQQSVSNLSSKLGGLSEGDLYAISQQITEADIAKGGKKTVTTTTGKQITIDFSNKEVRDAYLDFKTNVVDDSPQLNQAYSAISSLKSTLLDEYLDIAKNQDFDKISGVPNIGKSIQEVNGKLVITDNKEGVNEFTRILQKVSDKGGGADGYNNLSKAEKATLDMYMYTQMLNDGAIDVGTKSLIFKKMRKDVVGVIGWDGTKNILNDWNTYTNATGTANKFQIKGTSFGRFKPAESTGTPSELIGQDLVTFSRQLEESVKSSEFLPQVKTYSITSRDARQKNLKSAIGQSSNKDDIQITYEVDKDGKATGAVYYSYYEFDKETQKKKLIVDENNKLSKEAAEALGFKANDVKYNYDASNPGGAPTFNLGATGSEYEESKNRTTTKYGLQAMDDSENISNLLVIAYQAGGEDLYNKIAAEVKGFHKTYEKSAAYSKYASVAEDAYGNINVKLVPRDGQYHLDLERQGEVVYSMPTGKTGFTTDKLSDFIYENSYSLKSELYNQYLNSLIESDVAQTAIKSSQDRINKIISTNY